MRRSFLISFNTYFDVSPAFAKGHGAYFFHLHVISIGKLLSTVHDQPLQKCLDFVAFLCKLFCLKLYVTQILDFFYNQSIRII